MTTSEDRLFVPLKSIHYERFESGSKEWELRGINPQFNPDTVYEGRTVELRRGYSTDDSLWGEIQLVETYDSLEEIPRNIQRGINPTVGRTEFVKHARGLLGDYDRFIAFRPEGLHDD